MEDAGFEIKYSDFAPGRTSFVASLNSSSSKPSLCFTGHLDVVPLGGAEWTVEPFGADIDGNKLYGRGSTDMKSGVAAMVIAALHFARKPGAKPGIKLIITAGEEVALEGAYHLAQKPEILGTGGALIVGEPTSNVPMIGHKGILWLEATTSGVTAHGAMPEQGESAIYKAARAIARLEHIDFGLEHSLFGKSSLNVGTMSGGININSVPDHAEFGLDIRVVPGQSNDEVYEMVKTLAGDEVSFNKKHDLPPVVTDAEDLWVQKVFEIMRDVTGQEQQLQTAAYCTDASALTPALGGPPTLVLGPGEFDMLHKTDEYCYVSRIEEAVEAYIRICDAW